MGLFLLFFLGFHDSGMSQDFTGPCSSTGVVNDACEQIGRKFHDFLTGGPSIDPGDPDVAAKIREINESAQAYWDTMDKAEDRTYLWSTMPMAFTGNTTPVTSSYEMTYSFLQLSVMGQAYRTKGGALYENQELGNDLLDAILWMNENKFKIDGQTHGNWWDWHIGSPLRFIDCIVLMKDKMTPQQYQKCVDTLRVHVKENPPISGDANSMWNLFIRLMIGVLGEDDAYIRKVIEGLDAVWFKYSTSGDGFYTDGSYLMHGAHPYTGSYGASAIECAAKLAYLVNGTLYDLSPESKNMAIRWIHEAYAPFLYNGLMMDMTRGRSMSRETESDHLIGHVIIRSMYLVTLTMPESDARPIQELIKHWITTATHRSIYYGKDGGNNNNYVFFISSLKQLMNDTKVPVADKPVFHKQFPSMTRVVHSRPDFTFAISMYNHIVNNYEAINGENMRGWNMAAGMTYLYNGDLCQYSDNYWPTVDAHRLSGTTVRQHSETPRHTVNGDSWVGGTSLDGLYGITGMYLKPAGQTLSAKKSWFMFDDEIVALGSDIDSSDNVAVETIIENRKLKPDNSNTFTTDEAAVWAHLSGNDANSDLGYYFPDSEMYFTRGERSGSWREINTFLLTMFDRGTLNANYLTMSFHHGTNPKGASYSYVILPNKSVEQVRNYAAAPDITILENSGEAQGVYEKNLRITGVNFWNDTVKTVGPITSDRKASVMIRETDTEMFVSVSDPTKRSGLITLQMERNALECLARDENINIVQLSSAIVLTVDVTGKNGLPSYASFKKGKAMAAVPATGITLDRHELEMSMLDVDMTLAATVEPASASQFTAWSSSDPAIVEVLSGQLTPRKAGTAMITARTLDGVHEASCKVTVTSSNVALGKPATENNAASKFPNDVPYPASYAVDGIDDFINRWAADRNGTEDWLQIDLQKNYHLEGVRISWTKGYAKKFQLQISDDPAGGHWTTIHTETDGQGGYQTIRFDKTHRARYFRLHVASDRDKSYPQYGVSIQEIEVYGKE